MSNMKDLIQNTKSLKEFAKGYFGHISKLLDEIDINELEKFINEMEEARKTGKTIFFIGNGGSAATASHMANDLALGLRKAVEPPLRCLSLTDNVPMMTAIANDNGYENLFVRQIQLYYRSGDKVVAISASGNSPNVVAAAQWVKDRGGKVISMTGFDGGKLAKISDATILVKTQKGEYGPVEDVHMVLDHVIYTWIWGKLKMEENK